MVVLVLLGSFVERSTFGVADGLNFTGRRERPIALKNPTLPPVLGLSNLVVMHAAGRALVLSHVVGVSASLVGIPSGTTKTITVSASGTISRN